MKTVNQWKTIILYAISILWRANYFAYADTNDVEMMDRQQNLPLVNDLCGVLPLGSLILRPGSCTHWIRCPIAPNADYEEGSCVLSMYYNKDTKQCDFEHNVSCPYSDSEAIARNRCANYNDGVYLADESNCNGYIYCKDGRDLRSTCPGDLVFNPKQSACVYKSDYTCPSTSDHFVSPLCRSIPNDTQFADTNQCNKYHKCVNGVLKTEECPLDMAFDYQKGNCVLIDNAICHPNAKKPEPPNTICGPDNDPIVGIIADPKSCSGYYICSKKEKGADRQPQHRKCADGYFFDQMFWSCRDRLNVNCLLDRCEGMGNKYVNIAGDCKAYALCKNGVMESEGHCPKDYYFDERTQGCTPDIISYNACSPLT